MMVLPHHFNVLDGQMRREGRQDGLRRHSKAENATKVNRGYCIDQRGQTVAKGEVETPVQRQQQYDRL